jgi:lysine 2,3-aminomutase
VFSSDVHHKNSRKKRPAPADSVDAALALSSVNDDIFSDSNKNTLSAAALVQEHWKDAAKNCVKNAEGLTRFLPIGDDEKAKLQKVIKKYQMRLPLYYLSLIKDLADANDPILLQSVPSVKELFDAEESTIDPLGEEHDSPVPCIVHRYPDRVLFTVTGKCFMYCRHCTRKRLWREQIPEPTKEDYETAVSYVKAHPEIREVIVSGGDPLTLSTSKLDFVLSALSKIPHLQAIRIGTRAPVVLPQRIDTELCAALMKYHNLWVNVQFNHPTEVTPQSAEACRKLQRCGIPISNQSVLLKGINDDPAVMKELCQKLQGIRVRPYYLYQCDPVVGASHFRTSVMKGVEILENMRGHTGGLCVPTFVVDGVDGKGKVPVAPDYVRSVSKDGITLRNYEGHEFFYKCDTSCDGECGCDEGAPTVAVVCNIKKASVKDEAEEEYDEPATIEAIKSEIARLGLRAVTVEQSEHLASELRAKGVDFVFNIAEGKGIGRNRESQVPALLESLGIPHTGSDAFSLALTMDKAMTAKVLKASGVAVPQQYAVKSPAELEKLRGIFEGGNRFITKPRWEGSSRGVFLNSLVSSFDELSERVTQILTEYKQPAVIEEFLEKDEITVAVCGNGENVRLLGMMRIRAKDETDEPFVYSIEVKRDWQARVKYDPMSAIPSNIQDAVKDAAFRTFAALELRDIARIDFRLDRNNVPKVIDINPLPGLSPAYSDLPILYRMNGGTYADLIESILREALKRNGLDWI